MTDSSIANSLKIYAVPDPETKHPCGFYDNSIYPDEEIEYPGDENTPPYIEIVKNSNIPSNAVDITEFERGEMLARPQKWVFNGVKFDEIEVVDKPLIPAFVYDWQFAGQAAAENIITREAAKLWVSRGEVPQILLDAVAELPLPQEQKDRIELFLMGTKEFPRNHDLTPMLATFFGKDTPEKLDQFFIDASKR